MYLIFMANNLCHNNTLALWPWLALSYKSTDLTYTHNHNGNTTVTMPYVCNYIDIILESLIQCYMYTRLTFLSLGDNS